MPQRGDERPAVAPRAVLADQVGKGLAGPHLDEGDRRIGEQRLYRVGEPYRVAQLAAPVLGTGRLLVADPGAGHVGQERDPRRVEPYRAHLVRERTDGTV